MQHGRRRRLLVFATSKLKSRPRSGKLGSRTDGPKAEEKEALLVWPALDLFVGGFEIKAR